jgi:hypothetical protein
VRPHRQEVVAVRDVLATLVRRLRSPEPVTARGMALLCALLTDGTSSLYRPGEPGALGSTFRAAAAALEPLDGCDRRSPMSAERVLVVDEQRQIVRGLQIMLPVLAIALRRRQLGPRHWRAWPLARPTWW